MFNAAHLRHLMLSDNSGLNQLTCAANAQNDRGQIL